MAKKKSSLKTFLAGENPYKENAHCTPMGYKASGLLGSTDLRIAAPDEDSFRIGLRTNWRFDTIPYPENHVFNDGNNTYSVDVLDDGTAITYCID
jgi:hypothetical protein